MKTKIRLAGGEYATGTETDSQLLWTGELPLMQTLGMRIVDETLDDPMVYTVSQIAFYFNRESTWQTVFVRPAQKPKES